VAYLSVLDASRMAGVPLDSIVGKINKGELRQTPEGLDVNELIRVYPNLKPLASVKIRKVKPREESLSYNLNTEVTVKSIGAPQSNASVINRTREGETSLSNGQFTDGTHNQRQKEHEGTVALLMRELEWNKELFEQTNQQMAKQLAEQRAMIADQARRLDEKDRFWARQVEIAQSLLPAPEPKTRKKILGIF